MEKKQLFSNSLWLLLLGVLISFSQETSGQVRLEDAGYLNQLKGTWVMSSRRSDIIETWKQRDDSTWQGETWRIAKGDSVLQQTMILARREGGLYFMPTYEGREGEPVKLKIRVLKPIGFVAEDLSNDFPKKVTYRFKDANHLDARVEGSQQGTIQEYIFNYERK